MKKFTLALALSFLFTSMLHAQSTTVSATVVDSDGVAWKNGTWKVTFRPNPSQSNPNAYTINGTPLSPAVITQNGVLNGSGAFSMTVYQNTVITPTGSGWNLTVCPDASAPCGTYIFYTTAAPLNLSSALHTTIPAVRFKPISGTYGYTDGEATIQLAQGSIYWNVTSSEQRCYTGSAWTSCGGGGGGGASVSPPAYSIQIANSGATDLASDPYITEDPVSHSILVGGAIIAHSASITTVNPPPADWTFDLTTPASALASLGWTYAGTVSSGNANQLAMYPVTGFVVQGTSSIPNGITAITNTMGTGGTLIATQDNVTNPGAVAPTSIALNGGAAMTDNQGTGAKIQHSTGSTIPGNCLESDAAGNSVDAGIPCGVQAHQVQAVFNGNSCTLGDDGTGGSGAQCTQAWGSTISGTYHYWCQAFYDSAASCANLGNCGQLTVDAVSQTSTTFTYIIDTRVNTSRTHTVPMTCWAIN